MTRHFRNPDAMWREEDLPKEQAIKGLKAGEDVSELGTSIILLHGKMHSLNILGTEVWKLCDGMTLEDIVSSLQDIFDVEPLVLSDDVKSFLANLKELGLVYEK